MNEINGIRILDRLRSKMLVLRWTELIAFSSGIALLGIGIFYKCGLSDIFILVTSGLACFLLTLIVLYRFVYRPVSASALALHLDNTYPELQHSTELLLSPQTLLSKLASQQQAFVNQKLVQLYPNIQIPHRLVPALSFLGFAFVMAIGLQQLSIPSSTTTQSVQQSQLTHESFLSSNTQTSFKLVAQSATIYPPAYTGRKTYQTTDLHLTLPEQSRVEWNFQTTPTADSGFIRLNDQLSIPLNLHKGNMLIGEQTLIKNGFYTYQIQYQDTNWSVSDYYDISVIPDVNPDVKLTAMPEYTLLPMNTAYTINLKTQLIDDYGISGAHVVAVLSQGSGEQVKFQRKTFNFPQSFNEQAARYTPNIQIPLDSFEIQPGDEIYLHVEAWDNRTPEAQMGKSDTYLFEIEDTTEAKFTIDAGLGVDRIPEYFRSQRQLIIDTEKLLAAQETFSQAEFQDRSNELGVDQKLLRLRYGKFLGEEFESSSGGTFSRGIASSTQETHSHDHKGETHEEDYDHENHSHLGGYAYGYQLFKHKGDHEHAQQGEIYVENQDHENHNPEHDAHHGGHAHGHEDHDHSSHRLSNFPDDVSALMEPYVHFHDVSEELSYFDDNIKSKLRAALAQMWDAELYLRTHQPKKALPYEYKALKLIKEIQQASRVYVARVGFDSPPLKPDKRLTGELDEVKNIAQNQDFPLDTLQQKLHRGIVLLTSLTDIPQSFDNEEQNTLQEMGEALAAYQLTGTKQNLTALRALRLLLDERVSAMQWQQMVQVLLRAAHHTLTQPKAQQPVTTPANNALQSTYLDMLSSK